MLLPLNGNKSPNGDRKDPLPPIPHVAHRTPPVEITPVNTRQATIESGYNLPSHGSLAEARDLFRIVRPGIPLKLLNASPHFIEHSARS